MQKQLLQLRKFAIFCVCIGAVLYFARDGREFLTLPPIPTSRWPVAAGCFAIALLNFIFLYCPKGSGKRAGQSDFQVLSFGFLILGILHGCGSATFAEKLFSRGSWTLIGFIILYSGYKAMGKYRTMLDELEPATFRNRTGQMLRRLRTRQIIMWLLFLWSTFFLVPLCDIDQLTILHGLWLAFVLGGIGIAIYLAHQIRRHWCCPACRTRLPLPRTAWLLLPKRLPQEWQRCPHCGFDFDRELPEAEGAIPAAAPAA